jgi:hypothetical protein
MSFDARKAAGLATGSFTEDVQRRLGNQEALEKKGIGRKTFDFGKDIDALIREDPGAAGALVSHIDNQVQASSPFERLQQTLAIVAEMLPAQTHQMAWKALDDRIHTALTIRQQQLDELTSFFGSGKIDSIKPAPEREVIDGVSGLQSFMAAAMSGASHEDWLAHGTKWIAQVDGGAKGQTAIRGEDLKSIFTSDVSKEGATVSGRTTAKPMQVLLMEIEGAQDAGGKRNGRVALLKSHQGMLVAGQAVAHLLAGREAPMNIGNIQRAAWGTRYPNILNDDRNAVPFLSEQAKASAMAWGRAATEAIAAYEAGGAKDAKAFWEAYPLAEQAARTTHMTWVRMDDQSPSPTAGVKKNFDALSFDQQLENLRKFALATYGLIQADSFFRGELPEHGMVSDSLKGAVRESAQAAIVLAEDARNFADASRMQAEAVRTQALVSIKSIIEAHPQLGLDAEKVLRAVSPIFDGAVQESVERYDGAPSKSKIGASAASIVADELVPTLLDALGKAFGQSFTKDRIVGQASIDSLKSALAFMGVKVEGDPGELLAQILRVKHDNWGIENFKKMQAASDPPFTEKESAALMITLLLFNATWMTQQHIRAIDEEAAGKGDKRAKHDLVQWFKTVLSEKSQVAIEGAAPGLEALFVLGQDLMEAQAKGGYLAA